MDPNNPNFFTNSQDYPNFQSFSNFEDYPNTPYYPNSQFSPNLNQVPIYEQVQTSQNISRNLFQDVQQTNTNQKGGKNISWCVKEDVALMSSWLFVSEDIKHGRNQKGVSLWARVHEMFHEARAENPQEIGERNVDSMKGRWKRLNENANKWIAAYKEAYGRKRSGMSQKDIEKEAYTIYEASGNKFQDLFVFNEVMSKHVKWEIKLDNNLTRSRPENEEANEESGGSSKRSRTSEDAEYSVPSNPETPSSEFSHIPRPTGRDKAKNKGKSKTSESSFMNEFSAEIRELRLTRNNEVEAMTKLGNARIELELKKEERKKMKVQEKVLLALLAKDHLSPEDEEMKRHLLAIFVNRQ